MKFKLFFLFLMSCFMPAFGMEEQLNAEEIITHPRFIEIKTDFEEIGGMIKVHDKCISIRIAVAPYQHTSIPSNDLFLGRLEKEVGYYRKLWWHLNLPNSLKGLCILNLGKRYKRGEEGVIESVNQLPEELKELVLKVKDW